MKTVSILNGNFGNIYSLSKAINKLGYDHKIIDNYKEIVSCDTLIIPGVGSFFSAINSLKNKENDIAVLDLIKSGKNILGICLGMQILFTKSSENKTTNGLNYFEGDIKKFPENKFYKIPHMQWNLVESNIKQKLFKNLDKDNFYYFVHSHYAEFNKNREYIQGTSKYCKVQFTSAIEKDNVFGVQFHPEKSGICGLKILQNFLEL